MLNEETADWQTRLGWDFRPSADLVRRYVGMHSLAGFALVEDGSVAGYTYLVSEGRKGLIGDLYVRRGWRSAGNELRLLLAAAAELFEGMGVVRIESQLMMMDSTPASSMPYGGLLRVHPRQFMMIDAGRMDALRPGRAARKALIENWSARRTEEAAVVIEAAYRGHVDGDVNDQYQSVAGARRFLGNIMQYPGCGTFFAPASFVAVDVWTGRACGVSMASLLSEGVGHITQICVVPALKGQGLGYEMLRRSLVALREGGCRRASLTVTVSNTRAVRLYEHAGFVSVRQFPALVWEMAETGPLTA